MREPVHCLTHSHKLLSLLPLRTGPTHLNHETLPPAHSTAIDVAAGMSLSTTAVSILLGLFAGMLVCLYVGQRLGRRDRADATDLARMRLTAVEAAIFGLMGLMIAFSFSAAAQRYELRRQLTVDEANAIGTAYLHLDLLPTPRQAGLREKYRGYVEARLAAYRLLPDVDASTEQAAIATGLQKEIWAGTIAALAEAPPHVTIVVIPGLNEMINIPTSRAIAQLTHTPALIMALLSILGFVCSLLAGYVLAGTKTRQARLHLLAFAVMLTATVYVIFDLDYPRFGLIRLDFADQGLVDLLSGMK
jgi:Na+-driven multidrug efflux pump